MRIFTCRACGHRMRLTGDRCGKCHTEKPLLTSPDFLQLVAFVGALIVPGVIGLRALVVLF